MLDPTSLRRMALRLALLSCVCTLLAVSFASASYADYRYRDYDVAWQELLVRALADWWSWVALGPIVLLLATLPGSHRGWPLVLLVHVPAGLLCGVVKTALRAGALNAIYGADRIGMGMGDLARSVLVYFAIVAIVRGLDARRAARERSMRLGQLQYQLAESRLEALQMQLHPHFLFNTLNAISALVRRSPDTAERMIARLGDLLRLALDRDRAHLVTLQEELDLLGRYLEIEEIRFGDRLEVIVEKDETLLDAMVPNLILQPLVENAIRHGIGARAGPGRIVVRVARLDGRMVLEITDDGEGLPDDWAIASGVGLGNTRARLEQLYGEDDASFTLEAAPGGGTVARLRLPIERSDTRDPGA